jgi:hypothetical protein
MPRSLAPDLWIVDRSLRLPGNVRLGVRTTLVRLASGSLWACSPVPLDDALADEIAALGPVSVLVAPNCFHHRFVADWLARWPDARAFAAPGLRAKRPDVAWVAELGVEAPADWAGQIDQVPIAGAPKIGEVCFFHRASATLIVTDLVFNVQHIETWGTGLVMRLVGTHRRLAQSRSWRWAFMQDRAAAAASMRRVLEWDFRRVVMAHGDVLEDGAREAMEHALQWTARIG